ncbi:MAG: 3-oxoacyl-ACP reductase, partial [Hyphomicrobiaceae bacterium]
AKMAVVGLMQVLSLEGAKNNIHVNCLAPTAATRMTEDILSQDALAAFAPEAVTPGVLFLVSEAAPTRTILCAGAGTFERANITLTQGVYIGTGPDAPEQVAARFAAISDRAGEMVPENVSAQGGNEQAKAAAALKR